MSKRVFEREQIPTPRWMLLEGDGLVASLLRGGGTLPPQIQRLGLPLVVKPNEEGSSVGLSVVRTPQELRPAVGLAERFGHEILVEEYIAGRELSVAVLGDQPLPIVEIEPESGLYDYESKYTAGRSTYTCPAPLPEELAREIAELAGRAVKVLGCRGVCRVDFRLSEQNQPYCLEVNTIPGMTPTSLVPMAAKAIGMSYDQLVERVLQLAVADARRRHPGVASSS
jgi:D-alanine-D-alanine ligase